jgi:branched-chain amino acid transport system permease protein
VAAAGPLRAILNRALAAVAVVALLAFPLVFARPFPRHVMIMIFLYGALATGWNILAGYCGQISLGHAVYFGIGAYTSTLLVREAALTPWLGMVAGAVLAVLVSQAIGYPVFRLRGHYFAIATIGVGEIVQTLVINWDWVGGARGLFVPIKRPDSLLNFQFHDSKAAYYYIALGLLGLTLGVTRWLERSRRGYVFRAIREDQDAAASLGVHVAREKHVAMAVSAALTALGGTFWAQYVLFVDPESVFPLSLSILICLVAVLGGVGSLWGPVLGAAILVPLSEGTRVMLGGTGKAVDLVIYGAFIMLIAVFQPAGLIGLVRRLLRGGARSPRAARRQASAA